MVDAADLKSALRKGVRVRVPSMVPTTLYNNPYWGFCFLQNPLLFVLSGVMFIITTLLRSIV